MSRWTIILVAFISFALAPFALGPRPTAAATSFFVNGSSTFTPIHGCTSTDPCQTINDALLLAGDGDTITVAGANSQFGHAFDGVYCETLNISAAVTIRAASLTAIPGWMAAAPEVRAPSQRTRSSPFWQAGTAPW